ncbi:response regulator transcription factor [Cohnella zeiphila]|uniref:Response regulator n=1 Tax=Cohnella zeiphila TaxID=2761120 RepID=A0A7X0SGG9_9BACL|nr:response regulator [Cohnella zeiphila]MBB6729446.1 response regulator [Cohnella zeiphila]
MRLLIVDDEPVIRGGLVKMSESYKPAFSRIQTAENGLAALELIRQSAPDVVLTDIRMPKMDGLELCQALQEEFGSIQVAVISGYNDFDYAQKCIRYGVKNYLLKPASKAEIHSLFDSLAKSQQPSYLPISRYVDWIDRMEICIWSLQKEELERLLEEWREFIHASGMASTQVEEILGDCLKLLAKRFKERGHAIELPDSIRSAGGVRDQLDLFGQSLRQAVQRLFTARNGNFKDPMEEAKAYIDSRLSQEISLEEVAAMVGLSPTYFSALFKKMTSETFVHYRIHKRMEKAKDLLAVPHIRIVDVATEVGYDDYPHFTKTFKKLVGMTPSEFRSQWGIR